MDFDRILTPVLEQDLVRKMVLLSGPRQCGKTTLAKSLVKNSNGQYYCWDIEKDRRVLKQNQMSADTPFWVFDELHKFRQWRNWLKGVYDEHHNDKKILVTGSARLDLYSRGGDSLQGRYYFHRLHPITFSEFYKIRSQEPFERFTELNTHQPISSGKEILDFCKIGGFPEPLIFGSEKQASRWRLNYAARLVREEVRGLERIQELDKMELLYERLEHTVGSILSINSLREDLEVAFTTVKKWIIVFEKLFGVFRIFPFGVPRLKAVKKEAKLYFWDWGKPTQVAAQFENMIAVHLLRFVHWMEDVEGERCELRYFRDVVGHEVDFIVLRKQKPWFVVEAKLNDRPLDPNMKYFLERVQVPFAYQVSLEGLKDWEPQKINGCKIRVLPASRFLANLP